MADIRFDKSESILGFLNPFKNFERESYPVEVRRDPLLGTTSVYNPTLRDKAKAFFGENDPELIKRLVEDSEKTCIFCGDKPEATTPKYPPDILPDGRIRVNEAVLFANLFPLGKYHPVIVLGRKHFLQLAEFTPDLLSSGLLAAQKFLHAVYAADPGAVHASVNMNYLFPAGASLVHPHIQMLVTPVPYSFQNRTIEAADRYMKEQGTSFFSDLADEEMRLGQRYIARKDQWQWITAFSPMGTNEVIAVHDDEADFGEMPEDHLKDLAYGISKTLLTYESLAHLSFNATVYSIRKEHNRGGFRCHIRMITRQNLYQNYRNDDYFLQKMLQSELIIITPEELAQRARSFF
jgi:galactose-1-phosphate uridylyltransferase